MPYCAHCGSQVAADAAVCPSCQKPPFGPAAMPVVRSSKAALWIPLGIGCAVVGLAVAGIVAAIVIPNFFDAMQKAKQHRTLSDLRAIGTAIESYRSEHGDLPEAASIDELMALLEPNQGAQLRRQDGWQRPFRYACWSSPPGGAGCDRYGVASGGRDGVFEHTELPAYEPESFPWGSYDRDLVWVDGALVRFPGSRP